MAYRLQANEPVPEGIRRIVREEIDQAIADLTGGELDRHKGVHEARKRLKKIRAVLRLVRADLDRVFRRENRCFRDAGRQLSAARDAEAMIETLVKLDSRFKARMGREEFERAQAALVRRRAAVADDDAALVRSVEKVAVDLQGARARANGWPLGSQGFAAIGPGLETVYRSGRRALADAYRDPAPEKYHELRKRVKDHWYHIRLLREVWPALMDGHRSSVKDLSELLGDFHDLVVFRAMLEDMGAGMSRSGRIESLLGELAVERQAELSDRAERLGRRIYAEKPARFRRRMRCYWLAWQPEAG